MRCDARINSRDAPRPFYSAKHGQLTVRSPGQDSLYRAGRSFVDEALLRDGSLTEPGSAVWSESALADLHRRFIDAPDLRTGVDFVTKYRGQLAGASRETILLGAEAMLVVLLVPGDLSAKAKRKTIDDLLAIVPNPPVLPEDMVSALAEGLPHGGMSFKTWRDRQMRFVIEFALAVKHVVPESRSRVLLDPWAFHDLAHATPDHGGWAMCDAMLYLVHPETFEPMFGHKKLVAEAFASLVEEPAGTLDRQIAEIRSGLVEREHLAPDFDFYAPSVLNRWLLNPDPQWDELIGWMVRFSGEPTFDESERAYKFESGRYMTEARDALRRGGDWIPALRRAFGPANRLSSWQSYTVFLTACADDPETLGASLRDLWDGADDSAERVRRFAAGLPDGVPPGAGTRCSLASYLLMANGVEDNPFLAARLLARAGKAVGQPVSAGSDAGDRYLHGIGLLDAAIGQARARGEDLRDRLDAQSALWCVFAEKSEPPTRWPASLVQTWRAYRGEAERGSPWDEFVDWAERVLAWDGFEGAREQTLLAERALKLARAALEGDDPRWPELLPATDLDELSAGTEAQQLAKAAQIDPDAVAPALRTLWNRDLSIDARIAGFVEEIAPVIRLSAPGAARIASVLLIADGHERNPTFLVRSLGTCRRLTSEPGPPPNADATTLRQHAIEFFVRVVEECQTRDVEMNDVLDARLVTWFIGEGGAWEASLDDDEQARLDAYRRGANDVGVESERGEELEKVARQLYLDDPAWLRDLVDLVDERRQVILYGPPGTGKTFISRSLAKLIAGSYDRVRLVQFHPSYAYEDFIEGYRPNPDGTPPFILRPGPLRRIAADAEAAPDKRFVLIIDEINRGNIAKIFGELYFLLEYRDESIALQYSDDEAGFRLPANLSVIGTMNTSDRSIAILDAAIRRRFAFVELSPRKEPVSGVLERFLNESSAGLDWLPGVLASANELLHRHDSAAAIGPSHFLKSELTVERVERIWRYDVMPLIEEIFFDQPTLAEACALDRLRGIEMKTGTPGLRDDDERNRAEAPADAS